MSPNFWGTADVGEKADLGSPSSGFRQVGQIPQTVNFPNAQGMVTRPVQPSFLNTGRVIIPAGGTLQIVSSNPNRCILHVTNNGVNPANITSSPSPGTGNGQLNAGGGTLLFIITGPLYAFSILGTTIDYFEEVYS